MPPRTSSREPVPVLVTGGSGYIAMFCVLNLLEKGYRVRTTIRSEKRRAEVLAMLRVGRKYYDLSAQSSTNKDGKDNNNGNDDDFIDGMVEFFVADLLSDEGWSEAMTGCKYVLHVASPVPHVEPNDENELIRPAVEGCLRVLRFARDLGILRVVQTSSYTAVGFGQKQPSSRPFNESDWSPVDGIGMRAYDKSKTLAEKAAWEFMNDDRTKERSRLELTTIQPAMTFGPVLGRDYSPTVSLLVALLKGQLILLPDYNMGVVDVRDVAELHVLAMESEMATRSRFLCVSGENLSLKDMAQIYIDDLGPAKTKRISTRVMPIWLTWLISWFHSGLAIIWPEIGLHRAWTAEKAKTVLGWKPRAPEEAIIATGQSLYELGILRQMD